MAVISQVTLPDGNTYNLQDKCNNLYGTCTDSASTVAKTATLVDAPNFSLYTGVTVRIKFTNYNSATNPTLNVNSTGAVAIKRVGTTAIGKSIQGSWAAGAITTLTYDGTYWVLNNTNEYTAASSAYGHAEGYYATASGDYSHAEGYGTKATYNGSHAEGYSSGATSYYNTASADGAHVEGYGANANTTTYKRYYYNTASGKGSHAEGCGTTASGIGAHAEGGYRLNGSGSSATIQFTVASGEKSHAEGCATTASGGYSHAEGYLTTANTSCTHAEGNYTTASGQAAHSEGITTTASGYSSHAEGYQTTANHAYQHVFGQCNVLDPSTAAATARGNYVEIVGNGTSTSDRSNARTLDWDGNEVLAGSVTANGGFIGNLRGIQVAFSNLTSVWDDGQGTVTTDVVTSTDTDGTFVFYSGLKKGLVDLIYPVGSIYLSVSNTNPGDLFGGTWVSFGAGRTLVGVDTSDTDFDTVEETGGAKTVTLTVDQMPKHTHSITAYAVADSVSGPNTGLSSYPYTSSLQALGYAGNDQPHNNLQPYITTYMWKRTA